MALFKGDEPLSSSKPSLADSLVFLHPLRWLLVRERNKKGMFNGKVNVNSRRKVVGAVKLVR